MTPLVATGPILVIAIGSHVINRAPDFERNLRDLDSSPHRGTGHRRDNAALQGDHKCGRHNGADKDR